MITSRTFDELEIHERFKENLRAKSHTNLFAIQEKMLCAFMHDPGFSGIFLESPCGTGKTLAVLLPVIYNVTCGIHKIVIFTAPSEELCLQHYSYAAWLFGGVDAVRLFRQQDCHAGALEALFVGSELECTAIFFGTPIFVLSRILAGQCGDEPRRVLQPTILIIDEADNYLQNNYLLQLCEALNVEPASAFLQMSGAGQVQLLFSSATLTSKLDLLNSIRVTPGHFLTDESQPQSRLLRAPFDPALIYRLIYSNSVPLPALLVFDDYQALKTTAEQLVACASAGLIRATLHCVVKPFELQMRNVQVTARLSAARLTRRSLVLADIAQIRGLDFAFQTVIVAALETEGVQHALGRAGRGLASGIRVQLIDGGGAGEESGDDAGAIETELASTCKSIGQPKTQIQWEDIDGCERRSLEELTQQRV